MDRRLSRSNTIYGWDLRVRMIVPGVQKCLRTTSQSVVLSGFPTAVETSLGRLLPGTNAGTLSSNPGERQLPLPRDDIPPHPPLVVAL
jgi:hypothetical protein